MILSDRLTLDAPRRTKEGYLVTRAKSARVGVYDYLGSEVDPTGAHGFKASDTVKVYRSEDEVFSRDAVHSFLMKPITDDHPTEPVTADNWKSKAKGIVAGAMRDGDYLAFDLVMMDAALIAQIEDGKRELSNGYSVNLKFGKGTAPDGTAYDAVQTAISGNHVAVVSAGRAGPECRIADGAALCDSAPRNLLSMLDAGDKTVAVKTIQFDGLPLETTDAGEAAINKLLASVSKLTADLAARDTTIADRDAKIAKAEAERDAAQGKILDAAALDAAVTKRADLIATAKTIHDADYTGKSDADIRKTAVLAVRGASVADKSAAYFEAAFDILAADASASGRVADAISHSVPTIQMGTYQATVDAARKSADDLNAWRNKQ